MKDPTETHLETDYENGIGHTFSICGNDGEQWPCPTIQKWRKSKEFRIRELTRLTESLAKNVAAAENKISELSYNGRVMEAIATALLYARGDIPDAADITITHDVDYTDITSATDHVARQIVSARETVVTYKDKEWHA